MLDRRKRLTLDLPLWLVDSAERLVGCVFLEPHSTPGLVNHIFLHDRAAAFAHLAGRGVAQVGAALSEQIDRERVELEGWTTIRRFFALNRRKRLFMLSDLRPEDHAALAIMMAWSGGEDDEGMPPSEVNHNLEALKKSLPRLERAAKALKHAKSEHVPTGTA